MENGMIKWQKNQVVQEGTLKNIYEMSVGQSIEFNKSSK